MVAHWQYEYVAAIEDVVSSKFTCEVRDGSEHTPHCMRYSCRKALSGGLGK